MPAGFSVVDRFVLLGTDLAGAGDNGAVAAAPVADDDDDDDAKAHGSAETAVSEPVVFGASSKGSDNELQILPRAANAH